MKRSLFGFVAGLSLLLCVTAAALWPRSNHGWDGVRFTLGGVHWWAASHRGVLRLDNEPHRARERLRSGQERHQIELQAKRIERRFRAAGDPHFPQPLSASEAARLRGELNTLAQAHADVTKFEPRPLVGLSATHGTAVAVTAVLPALWLAFAVRRWLRRRAAGRTGLCATCGYDLTANESGVCPECGAPVPGRPLVA